MPHDTEITLSRLEAREVLAHLDKGADPDVRKKLEIIAEIVDADPFVTFTIPGFGERTMRKSEIALMFPGVAQTTPVVSTLPQEPQYHPLLKLIYPLEANFTLPEYTPIVMEPKLEKAGVTQEDLDTANILRKKEFDDLRKARMNKPIIADVNGEVSSEIPPDMYAFSQPDRAKGLGIERGIVVGDVNRAGDRCDHVVNGVPVFVCKSQHGYNQSPYVNGCPTCFRTGEAGSSEGSINGDPRPDEVIVGEESF